MREPGGGTVVWRAHPRSVVWTGLFWTAAVLSVLGTWLVWSFDRTAGNAVHAAAATALVAAVTLVWCLVLLRPRVELSGGTVLIVNPLATHRLRREEILAVTPDPHGAALFHTSGGRRTRAVALGETSVGARGERLAEVRKALGL